MEDDGVLTVYLPLEYSVMPNRHIRKIFEWLVKHIYQRIPLDRLPVAFTRFMHTKEYIDARRAIVLEDAGVRARKAPSEVNEAMAIHPGLRKCLDSMAFAYCETEDDRLISRTDYLSRTFIISKDVFEQEDHILRVYVVYREMAIALSMKFSMGYVIDKDLMRRFLKRFQNWQAYEKKASELGWRFRFSLEDI